MTSLDKIMTTIMIILVIVASTICPLTYNNGYRTAEREHNDPAYPIKSLEYVPPDHNRVGIDARGYYWVEAKGANAGDIQLKDCQKCHGDRWNRLGGWSSGQSLSFYKEDGSKLRENISKRTYGQ